MATYKKPKKERAKKYDPKLKIKGGFTDVFKVIRKNKEDKENEARKP